MHMHKVRILIVALNGVLPYHILIYVITQDIYTYSYLYSQLHTSMQYAFTSFLSL